MDFSTLFAIGNSLAMLGWLALLLLPRWYTRVIPIVQWTIPGLLSVVYCGLMVSFWGSADGGFGSIEAVRSLFASDALLLAGWLHYLAFDLLIGTWEAGEAKRLGMPHWLLLPCLLLTFMAGPAGWLLFILLRRRYVSSSNQQGALV